MTTIITLWRSHCNIQLFIHGRDRLLFVPSPTVYHIILQLPHEKAIYKQWRLTICTGLIKWIFWINKKKFINKFFPSFIYREQRGGVEKNDWAPQSHWVNLYTEKLRQSTGFKITNSHSPLHFPIRYMQKKTWTRDCIHSEGAAGPFLKANHIGWTGFINSSLRNTSPSFIYKKKTKKQHT